MSGEIKDIQARIHKLSGWRSWFSSKTRREIAWYRKQLALLQVMDLEIRRKRK
jgi:hypothetical protein